MDDREDGEQRSGSDIREEEEEVRYPTPLPRRGDTFFVKDLDPERKFLQERISPPHIDGYKWAADILLRHVKSGRAEAKRTLDESGDPGPLDQGHWLVYPIYFSFRQSIELSLKSLLKAQQAEGCLPAGKEPLMTRSHDLLELWQASKPWVLGKLKGLREATDSFEAMLKQIHEEDQGGDAGRFAFRRVGKQLKPSFQSYAPLSVEAVEDAGVKMVNYIQWIWTAIEDEQRRAMESSSWAERRDEVE